jgi:hypothetical protein
MEKPNVRVKVYLDNDAFVCASKDKPLDALKDLARKGSVSLYTSSIGYVEYSEWPKEFRARYKAAWEAYRQNKNEHSIRAVRAIDAERKQLETKRDREWTYWDVEFSHPHSSFEGLIAIAILGEAAVKALDLEGEVELLGQLVESFGIKSTDAQHLMIAHSGRMDYLLTWDKRLVRNAAKVPWLRPRVVTPDTFFQKWKEAEGQQHLVVTSPENQLELANRIKNVPN